MFQLLERFLRDPANLELGSELFQKTESSGMIEEVLHVLDEHLTREPENVDVIRAKAAIYRARGDERHYRKTLEEADRLQARAAFESNVGRDITVRSIEFSDLDFFETFKWEFQPHVTVLLGKNGYGKSYLLRALVAMLQCNEDVTRSYFEKCGPRGRVSLEIDKEGEELSTVRSRLVFDQTFGKVPVLAIPDMRYVNRSFDSVSAPPEEGTDLRSDGAWHLLNEKPYEGMINKLLFGLGKEYLDTKDFSAPIFRLIQELLYKLTGSPFRFHEIVSVDDRFRIRVSTEGNEERPVSIQKASQGTLSILAIVGIIYRFLASTHPNTGEGVVNQRGIVVIDEIDAHLHPAWQQRILQALRDTFPNVQFIVTAHSPLVVAGCKKYEVAVLRRKNQRFGVEVLPEHFIGATAEKMYARVFEIEESDHTYAQLATLSSSRPRLEEEAAELGNRKQLNASEQDRLDDLQDKLYYLDEVERIRHARRGTESLQTRNRMLERETQKLKADLAELQKQQKEPGQPGKLTDRLGLEFGEDEPKITL